jgi:hypothetical protein
LKKNFIRTKIFFVYLRGTKTYLRFVNHCKQPIQLSLISNSHAWHSRYKSNLLVITSTKTVILDWMQDFYNLIYSTGIQLLSSERFTLECIHFRGYKFIIQGLNLWGDHCLINIQIFFGISIANKGQCPSRKYTIEVPTLKLFQNFFAFAINWNSLVILSGIVSNTDEMKRI